MTDPRDFAIDAHGAQTYGEGEPYVAHLDEVWEIVRVYDSSPGARAAAYLHDAPEDTAVTGAAVADAYGETPGRAVELVTDPEGYPNRRTRKAALCERLVALDPSDPGERLALLVKAADRLANMRRCVASGDSRLSMYRGEAVAFRLACYRPGICDGIWGALDALSEGDA